MSGTDPVLHTESPMYAVVHPLGLAPAGFEDRKARYRT
jgi:hypothetical protein